MGACGFSHTVHELEDDDTEVPELDVLNRFPELGEIGDGRTLLRVGEGEFGRGCAAHGDMLASLEARGGIQASSGGRESGNMDFAYRAIGGRMGLVSGTGRRTLEGLAEDPDPSVP